MNAIQIVGLIFLVFGVVLQPIGWMYWLPGAIISFVAIVIGVLLIYRDKHHDPDIGSADGSSERSSGRALPGDIHGHSGWQSGGRSTSWESSNLSSSDSSVD
jgi:hypothetical protein